MYEEEIVDDCKVIEMYPNTCENITSDCDSVATPLTPPAEKLFYEYGNLILSCSCGNTEVIEYAIKDGIQVLIRTSDDDILGLKCSKCNHSISISFKQSSIEEVANKHNTNEFISERSESAEDDMGIPADNELTNETNV